MIAALYVGVYEKAGRVMDPLAFIWAKGERGDDSERESGDPS